MILACVFALLMMISACFLACSSSVSAWSKRRGLSFSATLIFSLAASLSLTADSNARGLCTLFTLKLLFLLNVCLLCY